MPFPLPHQTGIPLNPAFCTVFIRHKVINVWFMYLSVRTPVHPRQKRNRRRSPALSDSPRWLCRKSFSGNWWRAWSQSQNQMCRDLVGVRARATYCRVFYSLCVVVWGFTHPFPSTGSFSVWLKTETELIFSLPTRPCRERKRIKRLQIQSQRSNLSVHLSRVEGWWKETDVKILSEFRGRERK